MYYDSTIQGYFIEIPEHIHQYKLIKPIGKGGTSIIALCEDQKTHNLYAAKITSKKDTKNTQFLRYIENEMNILRKCDHPNIVKLYDSFEFKNKNNNDEFIIIIMEYCENGDLLDFEKTHKMEAKEKKEILLNILNAIKYLHQHSISHGDIKADNILLDHNFVPKLCDFGFSRNQLICGEDSKFGTLYYLAPELILTGEFNALKSDIWAIGIMLYTLAGFHYPYKKGTESEIIDQILKGNLILNKQIDSNLLNIITQCTKIDPSQRPDIEQIITNKYFADVQIDKVLDGNQTKNNVRHENRKQTQKNNKTQRKCHSHRK